MPPAKRASNGASSGAGASAQPPSKKKRTSTATNGDASSKKAESAASSSASLIDSRVSSNQAKKAFDALIAHVKRTKVEAAKGSGAGAGKKRDLLAQDDADGDEADGLKMDGDISDKREAVWLQVTVKQLHNRKQVKPVRVPLEYPLYTAETASACLFTKDPQREYKDLLVELGIKSIKRVVGVAKLKGKFKPFDARRQLLQDHDVFLADDRITPLLPGLLGKKFFDSKKQPILVNISKKKNVKENIEKALSGTYYLQNKGSNTSIKLGHLRTHTSAQLLANLQIALPEIVKKIPGEWSNVQALEVKTGASASLPIWNCALGVSQDEEGGENPEGRWAGALLREDELEMEAVLRNGQPAVSDDEEEDEGEEEEEEEKPAKKAKSSAKDGVKASKDEKKKSSTTTSAAETNGKENKKARSTASLAVASKAKKAAPASAAAKPKAKKAGVAKAKKG